jgi:hypothetical protein
MIGEDEAVGGDERARSATDAHGGQAQVFEERIGDVEAVLFFDLVLGELIEEPYALVGQGGQGEGAQKEKARESRESRLQN